MKKSYIVISIFILTISNLVGQQYLDFRGIPTYKTEVKLIKKNLKRTARPATIINTIPSPTSNVIDITFDGQYLWAGGYASYNLYQISPVDGTIIKSIPTSLLRASGLAFDGNSLWMADSQTNVVHHIDTANGNVISSFSTTINKNPSRPGGLTWDGNSLWITETSIYQSNNPFDSIFNIDTSGVRIQAKRAWGNWSTGLTFDGQYLYSSNNASIYVYKIDTATFMAIDSVIAPGGLYPNGLAFDGQYIWVSNNDSDSIYQIDMNSTTTVSENISTELHQLTVFPNPAGNQLTFLTEKAGSYSVNIINISGRTVKSFTTNTNTISIKDLSKGIYFAQFISENETITKKFIKE